MSLDEAQEAARPRGASRELLDNLAGGLRLAFLLPVERLRFHASANHFIAIVALNLALNFGWAFAFIGPEGFLNLQALPSELFGALLVLFAGYVIGRMLRDGSYTLLIPVAVGSVSIAITIASNCLWIVLERGWLQLPGGLGPYGFYYIIFGWWALATLVAVARLAAWVRGVGVLPLAVFLLLVLLPMFYLPAGRLWEAFDEGDAASTESPRWYAAVQESALYAQPELLNAALDRIEPERPGVEDLYFVGFAPYASQDVFMKETRSIEQLMRERFDADGRAVSLISHPSLVEQAPIASLTNLRRTLRAVGDKINPDEDVVLLHVTTHGSEDHQLSVEFWPLRLDQIGPEDLRAALDDSGIKWRIVVVSACYSGGFVDALKDSHTLVVTAADAHRQSFGCGNQFEYTYFSQAYFDEALRKTYSFIDAFALAKESIRTREVGEGIEPSHPQIFVGEEMPAKLASLQARLAALHRQESIGRR